MGIRARLSNSAASRVGSFAPTQTSGVVNRALDYAIAGVGPLTGAGEAGDKQLAEQAGQGDRAVERAVADIINNHVRMAGAQGFAANVGGLVTLAATVPANLAGLALIQARMVAAIAHLYGHDLNDAGVRTAVLTCLLGSDEVEQMVKRKKLPGTPSTIVFTGSRRSDLNQVVALQVATTLLAGVAGKRLATTVGKRIPIVGGAIGASTDGYSTWRVGKYAAREFSAAASQAQER